MGTMIISDSFMVRESLDNLFQNMYHSKNVLLSNINDISHKKLLEIEYIILDMKEREIETLEIIQRELKNKKIIVLDLAKNEKICERAIKNGVSGYILNIDNKDDFVYKINSIREGKKFYDSDLMSSILDKDKIKDTKLTSRENEIFRLVGKAYTNKEIAEELFITEYTVKKHISSILSKMNFKNRKDIIIHLNNCS